MKTVIYQGWRYTFDQERPSRTRWRAESAGRTLTSCSEPGIRKAIDSDNERESEQRGLAIA